MPAMKRMVLIVGLALAGVLAGLQLASGYVPANHRCPPVSNFVGLNLTKVLRGSTLIRGRNVTCAEALGVVRAQASGVGVTFSGNPENASSFRFKLYGLPGWTCYGDKGYCAKGGAAVEWESSSAQGARIAVARISRTPRIKYYGYKPREACPSNRTCVRNLAWEKWGSTAVGVGNSKTCSPGGFACRSGQMTLTYWRATTECGDYYYTRWRYRVPGEYSYYGYLETGTCIPRAEPLM